MASLYRTAAGEAAILEYYDRSVQAMGVPTESRYIKTRFGQTHLLVAGPEEAPPLVIFHGGNVVNPISLRWFTPLMSRYRIYAPDTIGHPGKSAQVKLSGKDDSYGQWAVDLLDGLGIDKATLIGPSFGGGITLRTAVFAPERIGRAILLNPSSLAMQIWRPIKEIVLPMLAYRMAPSPRRLLPAVQPMFTEAVDEETLTFVGQVYDQVRIHPDMPKQPSRAELASFTAPTMLIAAEQDIFFPAHLIVPKAKQVLPSLKRVHVLKGSGHYPSAAGLAEINEQIEQFLAATN